jgi:hypothetical protein
MRLRVPVFVGGVVTALISLTLGGCSMDQQQSASAQTIATERQHTGDAAQAALARIDPSAYTAHAEVKPPTLEPCDVSTVDDPNHRRRQWVNQIDLTLATGVDKTALLAEWTAATRADGWTLAAGISDEPDANGDGASGLRNGTTTVILTTGVEQHAHIVASSRCLVTTDD